MKYNTTKQRAANENTRAHNTYYYHYYTTFDSFSLSVFQIHDTMRCINATMWCMKGVPDRLFIPVVITG